MEEESITNFYLSLWTSQDRSWKEGINEAFFEAFNF